MHEAKRYYSVRYKIEKLFFLSYSFFRQSSDPWLLCEYVFHTAFVAFFVEFLTVFYYFLPQCKRPSAAKTHGVRFLTLQLLRVHELEVDVRVGRDALAPLPRLRLALLRVLVVCVHVLAAEVVRALPRLERVVLASVVRVHPRFDLFLRRALVEGLPAAEVLLAAALDVGVDARLEELHALERCSAPRRQPVDLWKDLQELSDLNQLNSKEVRHPTLPLRNVTSIAQRYVSRTCNLLHLLLT